MTDTRAERHECGPGSANGVPRYNFLHDVSPPRGKTLSETERQPRYNFLHDVSPPRGNTLSEMERQLRNYFLQDVPPLRVTLSEMER